LPVSSSAHVTVVPWLLGWDYLETDPELRKTFEVALHAGTALALAVVMPGAREPRRLALVATATIPPAVAGFVLERAIERHAAAPPAIAAGLAAGAVAMLAAERAAKARGIDETSVGDGLWLGLAQAVALVPGISRSGATLIAARWRGFDRAAAAVLSRQVALPVIAGATAHKASKLLRRPPDARGVRALAAGAAASFASTLVATYSGIGAGGGSMVPYAIYRLGLAAVILKRGAVARSSNSLAAA